MAGEARILDHLLKLVARRLIQLLLYQLFLLEALNRLELFDHLLARLPSEVRILEVLERRLVHMHAPEPLAKVAAASI